MRKLLIYLKDYKKESILGPLFKLLEASFELIVPLVVASMIDVGIPAQDKGYIVKMALVLVALGIIGLTSSVSTVLCGKGSCRVCHESAPCPV